MQRMLPLHLGLWAMLVNVADARPPLGIGNFHIEAKFGAHAIQPTPDAHQQPERSVADQPPHMYQTENSMHHHDHQDEQRPDVGHYYTILPKITVDPMKYHSAPEGHLTQPFPIVPDDEVDINCLMQENMDESAWRTFLATLRDRLDGMGKADRALCVDTLLRRLNWHATDSLNGYFLGHMGGRTASLTSLLVAFKDDVEVDSEAKPTNMMEGMWTETTHFIPAHPGSRRSRGLRIEPEEPIIMLCPREIPSDLLTPGTTPPQDRPGAPQDGTRRKRQCLSIGLSASSGGTRQTTSTLQVPMDAGAATIELQVRVQNTSDDDTTDTVPADSPTCPAGALLPQPAPEPLASTGISLMEFWKSYEAWSSGRLDTEQLALTYGAHTAAQLVLQWRGMSPGLAGTNAECEGRARPEENERNENRCEVDNKDGEADETVMLGVSLRMAIPLMAGMEANGMEERSTMEIIREHLHRQRGEGTTRVAQISTLYAMVEQRGHPGYLEYFPQLMEELDLEVDVDLSHRCLPGPTPFFVWVESELWESYLDYHEAASGHESDALQTLRGRPNMAPSEREAWRRWAGMPTHPGRTTRSRTPRREQRNGARPAEASRQPEDSQDATSFMHRYIRGDSRDNTRRRWRNHRGDSGRERERSRERGSASHSGGGREQRVRERITRETRRLVPECPPSEWHDWTASTGTRSEPARTSTDERRNVTGDTELDLLQATGEWFVIMGLRAQGDEQVEPANAITKHRQARARTTLAAMSERDVATMVRALMRLMGMLYIEAARLLTQAQDDRRRGSEMIEVDVDDDESIYMQQGLRVWQPRPWENLLQDLVAIADQSLSVNRGFLQGLRRRITNSLYLQTPRGQQLQATLIAIIPGADSQDVEICDTEQNDEARVEEWWGQLKGHMELSQEDTVVSQSSRPAVPPDRVPHLADPGHDARQVEAWETERQILQEEQREHEAAEGAQADAEAQQEREDAELYEAHLAAEQAMEYKNWENWVVLNTPSQPKRRRLLVEAASSSTSSGPSGTSRAEIDLPRQLDGLRVTLLVENKPDVPTQSTAARGALAEGELDINGDHYQRAYQAWKAGQITDQGIEDIFGAEWLFLFQVQRDGAGEDTMAGAIEGETNPEPTQLDVPTPVGSAGAIPGWLHALRPGGVLELDGDSPNATIAQGNGK